MHDMIKEFKHKIIQLKQNCSKLNKKNVNLKRIINKSKPNYFTFKEKKRRRIKA